MSVYITYRLKCS